MSSNLGLSFVFSLTFFSPASRLIALRRNCEKWTSPPPSPSSLPPSAEVHGGRENPRCLGINERTSGVARRPRLCSLPFLNFTSLHFPQSTDSRMLLLALSSLAVALLVSYLFKLARVLLSTQLVHVPPPPSRFSPPLIASLSTAANQASSPSSRPTRSSPPFSSPSAVASISPAQVHSLQRPTSTGIATRLRSMSRV